VDGEWIAGAREGHCGFLVGGELPVDEKKVLGVVGCYLCIRHSHAHMLCAHTNGLNSRVLFSVVETAWSM
jgi:hypothetical protein